MARALYTLEEWDAKVDRGEAEEPTYTPDMPSTGIECPNVIDIRGKRCRAHLWDFPFITRKFEKLFRPVGCSVCGWSGLRRLAKGKLKVVK